MEVVLNKTKTLVPSARIGTAFQQDGGWALIDSLQPDSQGDGWQWIATCHECTEQEAEAANAPRAGEDILAEQALLLPLLDALAEDDRALAQDEIDATDAAIEDDDLAAAEEHEASAQKIVRERLLWLVA
jgi:hypothetical protein